jgi:hypothetical protein
MRMRLTLQKGYDGSLSAVGPFRIEIAAEPHRKLWQPGPNPLVRDDRLAGLTSAAGRKIIKVFHLSFLDRDQCSRGFISAPAKRFLALARQSLTRSAQYGPESEHDFSTRNPADCLQSSQLSAGVSDRVLSFSQRRV